jgi:hypothetical protein
MMKLSRLLFSLRAGRTHALWHATGSGHVVVHAHLELTDMFDWFISGLGTIAPGIPRANRAITRRCAPQMAFKALQVKPPGKNLTEMANE